MPSRLRPHPAPFHARLLLEQAAFFRELSPQGKDALAALCRPRSLRKKEILFSEGDRGDAVYLVATGNIRLSRTSPDGREIVIKILQPGEFFAEVILFEQDRYPVTATATAASLVLSVPRRHLYDLLAAPSFRRDFIAMLMKKQRYLADQIYRLTTCSPQERFARFLEEHYGRRPRVELTFPKREIAAAIGATPETLSRLLLRLKRRRLLLREGNTLVIQPAFWESLS